MIFNIIVDASFCSNIHLESVSITNVRVVHFEMVVVVISMAIVVTFAVIDGHSVSIERIRVISLAVLLDIDLMAGNGNLLAKMLDQDHI